MFQCHDEVSLITYSECLHQLDIRQRDRRQMGQRKEKQGQILEHKDDEVKDER